MSCNYKDSGEVHPISRFLINPSVEANAGKIYLGWGQSCSGAIHRT